MGCLTSRHCRRKGKFNQLYLVVELVVKLSLATFSTNKNVPLPCSSCISIDYLVVFCVNFDKQVEKFIKAKTFVFLLIYLQIHSTNY